MKGIITRVVAISAAASLLLSIGIATTQAQTDTGNGFRISPVKSELVIEKGKSTNLDITIENPTDAATIARPIVNNFVASANEDGEARIILDENAPAPKNDFRKLVGQIADLNLGPREKKDISVKISIPTDASSGGYYGTVRFVPTVVNNAGNVSLTASVGTIVLVTVPGNLTERVDLLKLGAGQNGKFKSFITNGNVDVIVRLQNKGDIHVQPFGKVNVKDAFGKTVHEFELNKNRASILPGTVRKYNETLNKKSERLGRYTVTANIGYSQGSGNIITARATYWYVPTWAVYVLMVLLVLIVAGVYVLSRKLRGSGNHRAKR